MMAKSCNLEAQVLEFKSSSLGMYRQKKMIIHGPKSWNRDTAVSLEAFSIREAFSTACSSIEIPERSALLIVGHFWRKARGGLGLDIMLEVGTLHN